MKKVLGALAVLAFALAAAPQAMATGRATCEDIPRKEWQSSDTLIKQLEAKGWKVRRVKEDGGCYEVYALDEKGQRVEAYFHPKTLEPVPTRPR